MRLTGEQRAAVLAGGGDTCVSAAAGSGKTRVLTERYVNLLTRQQIKADQLVTITFTEAAAAEMRDRIARALLERGHTHLLRAVEGGYISTIHAFCLRMLREYALDANIDPGARLLADVEAARYRVHRREEMLAEHAELQTVVDRYRVAEAFHAVFEVIRHARESGLTPVSMVERWVPDGETLRRLLHDRCTDQALRFQSWFLDSVVALADIEVPPDTKAAGQRDAAVGHARSLQGGSLLTRDTLFEDLRGSLLRWTNDGGDRLDRARRKLVQATMQSAPAWKWFAPDVTTDLAFAEHRGVVVRVAAAEWERFDEWKAREGYVDFLDMLTAARDMFRRHRQRFLDRFRYVLVDEFQDTNPLQTDIIGLLTQAGGERSDHRVFVVGDARQSIYRFRQADVTVFRQFEQRCEAGDGGAKRLTLQLNFRSVPPILDFINALFASVWSERDTDLARDPLRPGRDLTAETASRAADASPPIAGPRVEALLYDAGDIGRQIRPDGEAPPGPRWLRNRNADPGTATVEECAAFEAEQIARRVRTLVEDERPTIFDPGQGRWRRLRYHDVALLLTARTHQKTFETVFDEHHLPYLSLGGRDFFQQPEVVDLTNALAITVNPRQDIPLAAVLRSPLANLSDDTLFWLATALAEADRPDGPAAVEEDNDEEGAAAVPRRARRKQRLLIEALQITPEDLPAGVTDDQRELFRRFRDTFDALIARRHALSCADMLEAWVSETGLRTRMQVDRRRAPQAIANIDKLIRLAAEFDHEGRQPLGAFVDSLLECRQGDVQEAEAPPAPEPGEGSPDAVRIMTIHAAKGLEFPVAIVPQLGRDISYFGGGRDEHGRWMTNPWQMSDTFGPVARLIAEPGSEAEETLVLELERLGQIDADRDETKRLLYVGATRAREVLLLVGHTDLDAAPPPWDHVQRPSQWLQRFLGDPPAELRSADGPAYVDVEARGVTVRRWREVPPQPDAAHRWHEPGNLIGVAKDLQLGSPIRHWPKNKFGLPATEYRARVSAHAARVLEAVTAAPETAPAVAATALATYALCPVRYYYSHVLGLDDLPPAMQEQAAPATWPEDMAPQAEPLTLAGGTDDADPGLDLAAREVGTLVHRVLELMDLGRLLPGLPAGEHPRDAVVDACERAAVPAALVDDTVTMVEQFLAGPIADELRQATNVEQEAPFALDLGGQVISGAIDLVYVPRVAPGAEREIVVCDFKTNTLSDATARQRAIAAYRDQLGLYALAVAARFDATRIRAILAFLRTRDTETLTFGPDALTATARRLHHAADQLARGIFLAPTKACDVCRTTGRPACRGPKG